MLALTVWLVALFAPPATYFPPPDSQGGWRTLKTPAEIARVAGVEIARLDQAFTYAARTSQHGGVLVLRHGYLVYERYYGKGSREAHPAMASVGKAYTSIACGIVMDEKRDRIPEGLNQKVFTQQYLPEALQLDDPAKADIRLGHLLTMTSGLYEGGARFVNGEMLPPAPRGPGIAGQDEAALHAPMWTKPGGGYSYASLSTHAASIVLRHLAGMEMQQYIDEKLARPMQWGPWGYARRRGKTEYRHTPGGADIEVRATDALRFGYLLLHRGRWGSRQLVPEAYVDACARPSPYNPHTPFSLQFEVNQDGHVAGAPRDAFFKSGAGGFGIYVVPSLDLVIYKMAGDDAVYDADMTGFPLDANYDHSRDNWKPQPHSQFWDGPVGVDDGVRRLLEMVVAAVR